MQQVENVKHSVFWNKPSFREFKWDDELELDYAVILMNFLEYATELLLRGQFQILMKRQSGTVFTMTVEK